jgi:hypothetical protein
MPLNLINGFEIDCTVREEHVLDAEVTEYPVEAGAAIADHIRPRPAVVTIEGIISDTPFGDLARRRGMDPELVNPRGLPSEQALAMFLAIRETREPVTIETSLRVYESMAMLSFTTEPRKADALFFTAVFKQVEIVENERTTVRVERPSANRRVDRGNKAPEPTTVPDDARNRANRALGLRAGNF